MWRRAKDAPVSVIRLPLVVDEADVRRRVEQLFSAMWQVKRALQRDARDVVDAYWAGDVRRESDVKAWRAELGLSRTGLEHRAYQHLERSGWLSDHVSKALVMHQADEVFTGAARHLHPDASERRAGRPKTGTWWEYTRIPGRARSHTTDRKWETFRLHGTLAGHLDTFTTLTDPDDPATARLDHTRARAAQILFAQGLQEALTESTAPKSAPSGRTRAAAEPRGNTLPRQRTASARRNAGPCTVATPDETRPAPKRPKAHAGTTRPHTGRPRTHIRDKS
jgi:hypothetical protein